MGMREFRRLRWIGVSAVLILFTILWGVYQLARNVDDHTVMVQSELQLQKTRAATNIWLAYVDRSLDAFNVL